MKKLWKTYLQAITDFCVKIAALEISVVETFKNISTVGVHCGYIKDAVVRFHQQIFGKKKKNSEDMLGAGCFHFNSKFISKNSSLLLKYKIFFKGGLSDLK